MLVKLMPDQVARLWGLLRPLIEVSLPPLADPDSDMRMNNILSEALADNVHVWVYRREEREVVGVGSTMIQEDRATGNKDLLLYSVYVFPGATADEWKDAFETIRRWALAKGCKRYVGYTKNPEMVGLLEKFGADMWTYALVPFVHDMDKEGG